MKERYVVLFAAVLFFVFGFLLSGAAAGQVAEIKVADFNKQRNKGNAGGEFGTWDKDPEDVTQGCRMTFFAEDALGSSGGMALRLEYDVDSPNPAYNGFWIKLDGIEAAGYDKISFYLRGDADAGYTRRIKVEIKTKGGGKWTHMVEGINDSWQRVAIPIKTDKSSGKKTITEFTIVFDDVNSRPRQGAILIDELSLTK